MSNMFDHYPQPEWYIPNNRPRPCKPHDLTILTGETTIHTFDVPHFTINEYCRDLEVIYKVGITCVIKKSLSDVQVVVTEHGDSIVTVTLSAGETNYFKSTVLDSEVQLKFYLVDNSTQYSKIYPLKIFDSLDTSAVKPTPVPPGPGILGGLGYTED